MNKGGYIKDERGFLKPSSSIAPWEREFSSDGTPVTTGDNGCGMIILLAVGLVIAIPSAIAAVISGTLIYLIIKIIPLSYPKVSFGHSYTAAFWTTGTYLVIAVIIALLQAWLLPQHKEEVSAEAVLKYFLFFEGHTLVNTLTLFEFHLLCVIISALTLRYKLNHYFVGFVGYCRAVVTTLLVISTSILATFNIALLLLMKYLPDNTI